MNKVVTAIGAVALVAIGATGAVVATSGPTVMPITTAEVEAAQQAWGNALVQISSDYDAGGIEQARTTAESVIAAAYGYASGPVLFKPTLTVAPQTFRTTADGALAYFVGGDPDYPVDTGFALKGWTEFSFENAAIYVNGDTAISMGNLRLTDKTGGVTTVDKTFGYQRDAEGNLRIVLHHSSLPYTAE